jgi:predicted Rossmann fold nucleotide-binding protein DprA/Smf involved in DNA uptake
VDFGIGDVRVGIVGSRRRTDRQAVEACVAELAAETVVITGGARGPDRWAEEAARSRGLAVVVH